MRRLWLFAVSLLPQEAIATEQAAVAEQAVGAWKDPKDMMQAFEMWFSMVRGSAPGLEILHSAKTGFGVRTTREIQEGDEIISIPKELVFMRSTALDPSTLKQRGLGAAQRDALARTTYDEDLLCLLLLRERARGDSSPFAPWIKMLPEKAVAVPSMLDPNRMKQLLDEPAFLRAKAAAKRRSDRYRRIKEQIRTMTGGFPLEKELATLQAFIWADSIVNARAIHTQKEGKVLVPFHDMLNHAPHPNARRRNHARLFDTSHRLIGSVFMITADRHTPSGQEVFEDYGDHNSEHYFHTSAFVPDENPFDCVTVQLPAPDSRSKAVLIPQKLKASQHPEACLRPGRAIPEHMLYHLHLLCLPKDAAAACLERLTADPEAGALLRRELQETTMPQLRPCLDESYTIESAWKKLLEVLDERVNPKRPARKPKQLPEDTDDMNLMFIPRPSEVQPIIDIYEASRVRLMRGLLESPTPPEIDPEEEALDPVDDPLVDDTPDKKAKIIGLEGYVARHSQPFIESLRSVKPVDKESEDKAAKCGIGVRMEDDFVRLEFGTTPSWVPAPKTLAEEPSKKLADPLVKAWPEPVRAKLLELRREVGKLLAEPGTGTCGAS